jgi:CspA family cold shock protein
MIWTAFFLRIDYGRAFTLIKEISHMSEEKVGTVKWFDARKGYGFIAQDGGNDIFVHANNLADPFASSLVDGDQFKFTIGDGPKGPTALEVRRTSA